jgi:sugar phosphate isomerase/epimerase
LVERFHGAGIAGIEPMPMAGGAQPPWWGEFYRAALDLGMQCACCDVIGDLVGEDENQRRQAIDSSVAGIDWCREVGCGVALLAGSRPAPGMSDREGRRIYAESLAKIAERTEGSGVTLTIEDFGVSPTFTCTAGHVLEVVRLTGREDVKVTFDNGNFLLADEKPMDVLGRMLPYTVHVHLKDFAAGEPEGQGGLRSPKGVRYIGCEIGAGEAQVAECIAALRQARYGGWLSLEVGLAPAVEESVRAAGYVSGMIA